MALLRDRKGKINFAAVFTLACFVFVVGTTKAVPQSETSNNKLVRVETRRATVPVLMQLTETPTTPSQPKDEWWLPIVVAMIAALGSITVAILNPQFVSAIVNPREKQRSVPTNRRLRGIVLDKITGMGVQGGQISLEAEGIPSIQSTDAMGNFIFFSMFRRCGSSAC